MVPLEKCPFVISAQEGGMFKSKVVYEIKGKSSEVQISNLTSEFVFLINKETVFIDFVKLYKCEEVRKYRYAVEKEVSGSNFFKQGKIINKRYDIDCDVLLKNNTYVIKPTTKLTPGEYFFFVQNPGIGFCFSVK